MTKFIKKLLTMCTVAVIAMMQVTSASAVTETFYAGDWVTVQGVWDVSLYDVYIMSTTSQYCVNGVSKGAYTFDQCEVEMIIHRNAPTNIIKNYEYSDCSSFSESETVSGDATQNGTSTAHITIVDNYYGTILNEEIVNR